MRVLVTGASGFLGGNVCAALSGRGHSVSALVRRPGSEPAGTTAVHGDLSDGDALAESLRSVAPDCVIHLAAEIASQRDRARIEEVNVAGTKRLLDAAVASGRPRFIFASTVVTGDAEGAELTESMALPVETAYGRSKQEGEGLVRESGLDHVIIRPGHVYGPGGWYVEEFVTRLRQPGRFVVIGRGENWWDVVHSDDVTSAFVAAAESSASAALYHVVDDEPLRYYDFVAKTADALGLGAPRRVPVWLAKLAAGSDPVRSAMRSARTQNGLIKRELGWQPKFPTVESGIPDAIARIPAKP